MLETSTKAVLAACLTGAVMFAAPAPVRAATIEIKLIQTVDGKTYFDPVGLHIAAGDRVRWVQISGFHSITAYHPQSDNHEARIPQSAQPWDSDILQTQAPRPGSSFEHVFTVLGVYDYFCKPHELAGMVGRIVVGDPGDGPGTKPFGYAPDEHWRPVPETARRTFPAIAEIMRHGEVRAAP